MAHYREAFVGIDVAKLKNAIAVAESGAVAGVVGIEVGVVSGVINLESSDV